MKFESLEREYIFINENNKERELNIKIIELEKQVSQY